MNEKYDFSSAGDEMSLKQPQGREGKFFLHDTGKICHKIGPK